jgi:hypothetical protein
MKNVRRCSLLFVAAGVAACGGSAVSIATSTISSGRPGLTGTAAVVPAHLWIGRGQPPGSSISVLDTKTRASVASLPDGVPTRDWSHLYAVTGSGAATVLEEVDTTTGKTVDSAATDAGFALPSLGPSARPLGLSPNSVHLVLEATPPGAAQRQAISRFLIYDTTHLRRAPLRASLPGNFTYDGISNDGRNLYLLEDLGLQTAGGGYHVRRYDVTAGALDPAIIVDKRTGETSLSGAPTDSVTSLDGSWQFTVYAFGAQSPFVHALNLNDAISFCIDLPKAPLDESMDLLWGLARSHDGRFVYAVNTGNGAVFQMPTANPWQTRQASLAVPTPTEAASWLPSSPVSADAKRVAYGAAVISSDDRTLYSIGDRGVFVIDTASLTLTGSLIKTQPLTSLVMSADGSRLYAVSVDSVTPLLQVDVRNGAWAPIAGVHDAVSVLRALP